MESHQLDLNATAYVILGMVRDEPCSGYEIKARVDGSIRFFWAVSYGQIYPELRKLSEAGLVEGSDAPRGDRKRTVYEITAAGKAALEDWLRQPPRTYEARDEGLLKLFFAGALPAEEAVEILRSMREHRVGLVERLRATEPKALEVAATYPLIVLRAGIELNEWFAAWCARTEAQLLESARRSRAGR